MRADTKVTWFDSSAALAEAYESKYGKATDRTARSGWTGESLAEALDFARNGREHLVADAEALIGRIENAGIALEWPRWQDSMVGALPNVPAFLAGVPETMRVKRMTLNDRAPIRMFCELTSSGGIDVPDLAKRGTAMLALAMLLSQQRPVELYAVAGLSTRQEQYRASLVVTRIPAAPLELATACNVLTSAAYARDLGYKLTGGDGGWAWNIQPFDHTKATFISRMREALDMSPQDFYLEPPHWNARHEPILKDPVAWINGELLKYSAAATAE
jgi:hypothetical protein